MLQVQHLAKRFEVANAKTLGQQEKSDPRLRGRFFHSLEDLSFCCEQGQVLALVGANGAGKTTALRLLSGALAADKGSIMLKGQEVAQNPTVLRQHIGFLSGSTGLYGRLSGAENLQYFGQLYGLSKGTMQKRIDELAQQLTMQDFLSRRCEHYSTGMRQKVALARAVIHQPPVVILDEPTTGLDINATETVLRFIKALRAQGCAVIFSTHHLDEVQELSDQLCIMLQGRDCFVGTLDAFRAQNSGGFREAMMQMLISCEEQRGLR